MQDKIQDHDRIELCQFLAATLDLADIQTNMVHAETDVRTKHVLIILTQLETIYISIFL